MAATETSEDVRVHAVLAVLGGESASAVAAELGCAEALVVRWTQQFVHGGSEALKGNGSMDAAARDRFLALLAHEVRTPLTVITGWVHTLEAQLVAAEKSATDDPMLGVALTAMSSQCERLRNLADDLRDSAAVAMGRLQLDVTDVDVGSVVGRVVEIYDTARIELVGVEPATIRADAGRLRQMLSNLVADGLSRTVGSLQFRVVDGPATGWVEFRLRVPGPPPPMETMLALFEPFDRGTGDAFVGLGLYVTRALAVAHGGQCGADADDDSITFWIRLPPVPPTGPQ